MAPAERRTLTARVHQHLLSKLATRELAPGAHLNATALAVELDTSRTTVRKVIDQFIDEGWVQIDGSRHPIVVKSPRRRESKCEDAFEFSNQTESTYRAIQEKVLRGEYQPGETVRARQLIDEFGVSLVTVRQALDWLCRDGLFARIPRRGWQVVRLSLAEVRDIYRCRLLLEPLALRDAIKHITNSTIDALMRDGNQLLSAGMNVTEYDRLDIDMKFHRTLVENAGSQTLSEVIAPLLRKRFVFTDEYHGQHQRNTFPEEHNAILTALRDRDEQTAVKRLKDHLRRALNTHVKHLKRRNTSVASLKWSR